MNSNSTDISNGHTRVKSSEIEEDILRPLADNEIYDLLYLYEHKYGNCNFHYLLLYNQVKWNKKLMQIDCNKKLEKWLPFRKQFYTHRGGDFRKTGTYLSLHCDIKQSVSFNTWQPECTDLYEALSQTKLIDWQNGPLLTNVEMEFCVKVKEIACSKNCRVQRARQCLGLILRHDEALKMDVTELPPGYVLRKIQIDDAHVIHDIWPNNKEGSLAYVQGLTEINKTLGIYSEGDNSLVAWIFQNDFSGLGILQVMPAHQRKGFGTLLATQLSKWIAETEICHLSAWIVASNTKSMSVLSGIGFKEYVTNEWIQLCPTTGH